ncbi:hypothetical protein [Planomicrobium sp. CPCC 101079]|uniref:hypothetical protein n=1 Tax=Planomicrobium sp. CPCC 101079 TaxID=2599618 RepID=UPI0011B8347F|nr:hypothetical protein [Planomicrobium sp. CPCC 101079]TWT13145.1 hypothetical protein FQV28_03115 [Planomicrobium sp. CPCC 101079]
MSQMEKIYLYGEGITDLETSPFEMLEAFHIRSELHHLPLSKEEKKILAAYDLKLLSNVKHVFEHTNKIYDFSQSKEAVDEWWWHLDLLLKGEIILSAMPLEDYVS